MHMHAHSYSREHTCPDTGDATAGSPWVPSLRHTCRSSGSLGSQALICRDRELHTQDSLLEVDTHVHTQVL